MIFKKTIYIVVVILLFSINSNAQDESELLDFDLSELQLNDKFTMSNIYGILHMDTTYLKKDYSYVAYVYKISEFECDIEIIHRPLFTVDLKQSIGFLTFYGSDLILLGDFMPCYFNKQENKKSFSAKVPNKRKDFIERRDYMEWIFYFKEQKVFYRIR